MIPEMTAQVAQFMAIACEIRQLVWLLLLVERHRKTADLEKPDFLACCRSGGGLRADGSRRERPW